MSKKLIEYIEEYLKLLLLEKAKPKKTYNIDIIDIVLPTLVEDLLKIKYEQE